MYHLGDQQIPVVRKSFRDSAPQCSTAGSGAYVLRIVPLNIPILMETTMTQRSKCVNFQILKRNSIRSFRESLKFSCKVFLKPYCRHRCLLKFKRSVIACLYGCLYHKWASMVSCAFYVNKIIVNCHINISSMFKR
jgi:hypothetical protein